MADPSLVPGEPTRTQRIVNEALRGRVTIGLTLLALLGSVLSLLAHITTAQTVGAVLGFLALLLLLAQIAGRSFLMQVEQRGMLLKTEEAAKELQIIRRNTEEELRAEEKQTQQLELMFTAMREFNLIQVKSLDALRESRPTTSFYLQRHAAAIVEILGGHWDRSEYLRPEQLWREYSELVTRMRSGETFRSTVCVPSDPAILFDDPAFNDYVNAIYDAAVSQKIKAKRLFVLDCDAWPPSRDSLDRKVLEHLRKLAEVENESEGALKVRVASEVEAKKHFHLGPPDFMMWGDGLLILSDLEGPGGLVTRAEFYFSTNNHAPEIVKRQTEFDNLFNDPKRALPLAAIVE